MALQQIQKSSTFKPDMIGDVVEVTVYDQTDGTLSTVAGILSGYSTSAAQTAFKFEDLDAVNTVPREGFTLSVTHYEFNLGSLIEEDDE